MPNCDSQKKLFSYKTVLIFSGVILFGLAAINLVGTNVLSTQGFAVSESETETLKLEKENQKLSVMIEESTTLSSLERQAEDRGFIRSKSIVFVPATSTFASR
ncbi:MAG: hypothetical protein UW16_C0029G0004 [Microgenomates group bacterium GW2011_GWC1_44_10]|uniref:Uncharacterized protein n=1 Tax=Candidatus Woesebacteria bacterium GW2011_GWA2_44_33 TaxID=1618564 RepID=A0A0G1J7Y5_9BACT|nr:MAG: hypothetical protein UW16_C0029G0004 [Microgenomates group bacterium GW2011_GWC1_44_10]KKT67746.1 MAG: hypothetical protein UW60_C0001G0024 [Candidatus Woesebacteria bacterium GW2011_GWA2_44_33]